MSEEQPNSDLPMIECHPIEEILEQDGNRSAASQSLNVSYSQMFAGPLPHPEILAGYERVAPGTADRLISMAERDQIHRHAMDNQSVTGDYQEAARGQYLAVSIALLVLIAGCYFCWQGHPIEGVTVITADLIALVGLFIFGNKADKGQIEALLAAGKEKADEAQKQLPQYPQIPSTPAKQTPPANQRKRQK